jgi:hypothetical protein
MHLDHRNDDAVSAVPPILNAGDGSRNWMKHERREKSLPFRTLQLVGLALSVMRAAPIFKFACRLGDSSLHIRLSRFRVLLVSSGFLLQFSMTRCAGRASSPVF